MTQTYLQYLDQELQKLKDAGLYKRERVITSAQDVQIKTDGQTVINLCANNYLSLANHPDLIAAGQDALKLYGYGMASVRFICGTQTVHQQLEAKLAEFLGFEDCILYGSCFDANGGLFETLLGAEDAVISDALNHASIIDGIRLCKAQRFRYQNNNMQELEARLQEAAACRFKLIATDGIFSMDGSIARLKEICDLADTYGAMVMVDDSHAVGFMGAKGRGTPEHCAVMGRIDIVTGTLGKALGGASGGYTVAKKTIIDVLRQRSRPYLFSNTLAPVIAATSLKVLDLLVDSDQRRKTLHENARYFRKGMETLGFRLLPGEHPIIPVMIGDAGLATRMADALLKEGIYVIGFSYPVVPEGQARIRTQISADLSHKQLDMAIAAFAKIGRELGIISRA